MLKAFTKAKYKARLNPPLIIFDSKKKNYIFADLCVVRRRGRLAPRQPLSVCALLCAPREEQAFTASWEPRPPFEAAEMD